MRKTPVVLGIIAMILGGLSAFGGAVGLAMQLIFGPDNPLMKLAKAMPHAHNGPDPSAMIDKMMVLMKELHPWLVALTALRLVLAVALLMIGIGLYKHVATEGSCRGGRGSSRAR